MKYKRILKEYTIVTIVVGFMKEEFDLIKYNIKLVVTENIKKRTIA